jgi:hypothetical protein
MRVWDIPVENLCNKHLVAQHYEIHCIYSILTKDLKGYRNHPEIKRWRGNLKALVRKHETCRFHMEKRGYKHNSPLLEVSPFIDICADYPESYQSIEVQKELLKNKGCQCKYE